MLSGHDLGKGRGAKKTGEENEWRCVHLETYLSLDIHRTFNDACVADISSSVGGGGGRDAVFALTTAENGPSPTALRACTRTLADVPGSRPETVASRVSAATTIFWASPFTMTLQNGARDQHRETRGR